MAFKLKHVDLSFVDLTDCTYKITTRTDIQDLIPSFNDIGVINPPFLIRKKKGDFRIINGFRRIQTAITLGWSKIQAHVITPDTPQIFLAKLSISDNSFQRSLNLIEQSRSIQLLTPFYDSIDQLTKEASSLQLPCNQSMINKLKSLSCLPQSVQDSILANTIALPVALMFMKHNSKDTNHLIELFDVLKLNLNKQREVMTLITEISRIEEVSISDVIRNQDFQKILTNHDIDRPLKVQKVRHYLKQKRFPEILQTEKKFNNNLKALKLDEHTKLTPPKFFEGMNYSITLSFSNIEELKNRRGMLDNIILNPVMAEILD